MGKTCVRQAKLCLFPEVSGPPVPDRNPPSLPLQCSGSRLKEWVVITAEAERQRREAGRKDA